ncbi:substrate-binding domain-containing protein [Roseospira visakhapatnamensis]|uniref:Ribose transport system substrate-binding protein n=1 Tax=Roseospira visakhapatnamensis TaxID=390880 RepID=A0A7W6RED2_9PROT|nr:substrate-binding domain-containing protein [Roseospira visakhapatnamensis]MBB4266383.1 ribose transport system substrate-binding protein [Roseospira visakhapatnamensis]
MFRNLVSKMLKGGSMAALAASVTMAASPVSADDYMVGFSNRTLNGPYFSALTEHVKTFGQEAGWTVITTDARADLNKQIADVEDMVARGIDALILNPQDPAAGQRIVESVRRKGIPVVIIDSDLAIGADVVTRVNSDNATTNQMIGAYAAEQFGSTPINVALISGNQGNLVGHTRSRNFFLGIIDGQLRSAAKTNFSIVTQVWGKWDQQGGLKAMEDVLVAHPEVNAVYTENDDMALGAIHALRAADKLDDVRIYSYDGNKNAYKAIMAGRMEATGENNPKLMAEMAIDIIKDVRAGNTNFPDYSYTPSVMINADNVESIYDPDSLF